MFVLRHIRPIMPKYRIVDLAIYVDLIGHSGLCPGIPRFNPIICRCVPEPIHLSLEHSLNTLALPSTRGRTAISVPLFLI